MEQMIPGFLEEMLKKQYGKHNPAAGEGLQAGWCRCA